MGNQIMSYYRVDIKLFDESDTQLPTEVVYAKVPPEAGRKTIADEALGELGVTAAVRAQVTVRPIDWRPSLPVLEVGQAPI